MSPLGFMPLKECGKKRKNDDGDNDGVKIIIRIFYMAAEYKAEGGHAGNPNDTAYDVEHRELMRRHFRNSRNNGYEGADDRQETRKEDRFVAVFYEEGVGAVYVSRIKKARSSFRKKRGSDTSSENITDTFSKYGGNDRANYERGDVECSLRGEKSRSEKQAITRKKKAKKEATFGKYNENDAEVSRIRYDGYNIEHSQSIAYEL